MSWYLKVTSKFTGELINAEYRDIAFANADEEEARRTTDMMNAMDRVNEFELCNDSRYYRGLDPCRQTTFKFIPETKHTLRLKKNRNPILLMDTAKFIKTKEI